MKKLDRRSRLFLKIMANIERDGSCWLWKNGHSGSGRGGGYGRICIDGGTMAVHRVMYILKYGPIPPKKQIDHTCTNRACCNPRHLKMVTHKQNQKLRDQRRQNEIQD